MGCTKLHSLASVPSGNYFNALIRFSLAKVRNPGDERFPTGQECLGSSRVEETSSNCCKGNSIKFFLRAAGVDRKSIVVPTTRSPLS